MHKLLLALSGALEKTYRKAHRSKKHVHRSSRRLRCFESLESRELLAADDWLGTDWQYRSPITIHSEGVAGTTPLANFPLLIDSTQASWRGTASGGRVVHANGRDFAFTLADGQTRLDYEIEAYDPNTGHLTAWVRMPELASQQDTTVYAYYGNAIAGTPPAPGDVWTDYESVYHFTQDPVSAATLCGAQACDSTANSHHLYGAGMLSSDSVAGKTGNALSFARAGTGLHADNFSAPGSAITVSTWIRADKSTPAGSPVSLPYSSHQGWDGFDIYTTSDSLHANLATSAGFQDVVYPFSYADRLYHYVAAVYDGLNLSLYVDGELAMSTPQEDVPRLDAHELNVGYFSQHWSRYRFSGEIDEVRIAAASRSADWLKTEYANQSSVDSFYTIASEQWNSDSWTTRIQIDIDTTGQAAILQDYQVSVNVPYREGMRYDFADIRFTGGDRVTLLDYWLEQRVLASQASFWVKIPSLPPGASTSIYLYYGNAEAASVSDGSDTFPFFDDFNDSRIDTNLWSVNGTVQEYNGSLVLKDDVKSIQSIQSIPPGYALRHRSWQQERGGTLVGFAEHPAEGYGYYFGIFGHVASQGGGIRALTQGRVGHDIDQFTKPYTNQWQVWETAWTSRQVTHTNLNDEVTKIHTTDVAAVPVPVAMRTESATVLVDWLMIRQVSLPEPVVTLGLELPNPVAPPPVEADAGQWLQVLPDDPADTSRWISRDSPAEVVFQDAMWIMGGWTNTNGRLNDVWRSTDGVNWEQVNAAAPWAKRNAPGATVHNGKIWIAGGNFAEKSTNDVWFSEDGATWTLATAAAPWGPRGVNTLVSFNDRLYVIGGMNIATNEAYDDVWSSSDGVNWTLEAEGVFPARAVQSSVVFQDRLWILGGGVYDATLPFNNRIDYNDVWSTSDGTNWTAATLDAPWTPRLFASAVVHRGYMWLIGGYHRGNRNDVWVSSNGEDWFEVQELEVFSDRHDPAAFSFQGALWVMGGFDDVRVRNDIWVHP